MKIIIVGATGTVGKTAVDSLSGRHEIIRVGRTSSALDGFVKGAAVDMPRGIRINAVSPKVLEAWLSARQ